MASWENLDGPKDYVFQSEGCFYTTSTSATLSQTALKSQERVDVLKDLFVLLLGYNLLISSCKDHYGVREITGEKYVKLASTGSFLFQQFHESSR